MHIVLVCREYVGSVRGGGIGSYMHEIACAYIAKGHKVTVVTASDDTRMQYETITDEGIIVKSLSGGDFLVPLVERASRIKKLRCIYRFYSYRKKLRRVIDAILDADIVEVADYGAEALCLQNLSIPVVIRSHTPQSLSVETHGIVKPKWWHIHRIIPIMAEKRIFINAKYITGCSQAIIDWISTHFDISKAKTAVIKNPVSNFANELPEHRYSPIKTIFYAGTISATKGVKDLVNACAILRNNGLNVRLKLAGKGGSFQSMLQTELTKKGFDWVEFLGKLSRKDVFLNYCSADVCCFPSWWENMPMVVLESMAVGAIVVSTNAGGTKEIITNGYDGFLCERRNSEKLSESLYKALSLSEYKRDLIRENAKQTIRNKFSIENISSQMLGYFDEVIKDFNKKKK